MKAVHSSPKIEPNRLTKKKTSSYGTNSKIQSRAKSFRHSSQRGQHCEIAVDHDVKKTHWYDPDGSVLKLKYYTSTIHEQKRHVFKWQV